MPNKAQFIDMLAERLDGDRKRAAAALDAVIDSVYSAVSRGERVAITGFGVFERTDRAARTARNPATGASVEVPAATVPRFRPGAEFKAIAGGAREFVDERASRAQGVLDRATAVVKDAQDRAASLVSDAVETGREAVAAAADVVTPGKSKKKGKKAGKPQKTKDVGLAPTPERPSASQAAATATAAQQTAAKAAPAKKAAAKKAAAQAAAKKLAATKAASKEAAKKAPSKKASSSKKATKATKSGATKGGSKQ